MGYITVLRFECRTQIFCLHKKGSPPSKILSLRLVSVCLSLSISNSIPLIQTGRNRNNGSVITQYESRNESNYSNVYSYSVHYCIVQFLRILLIISLATVPYVAVKFLQYFLKCKKKHFRRNVKGHKKRGINNGNLWSKIGYYNSKRGEIGGRQAFFSLSLVVPQSVRFQILTLLLLTVPVINIA